MNSCTQYIAVWRDKIQELLFCFSYTNEKSFFPYNLSPSLLDHLEPLLRNKFILTYLCFCTISTYNERLTPSKTFSYYIIRTSLRVHLKLNFPCALGVSCERTKGIRGREGLKMKVGCHFARIITFCCNECSEYTCKGGRTRLVDGEASGRRFHDDERIESHTRTSINASTNRGSASASGESSPVLVTSWRHYDSFSPSLSLSLSLSLFLSLMPLEGRCRGFNYADESAQADARPSSASLVRLAF